MYIIYTIYQVCHAFLLELLGLTSEKSSESVGYDSVCGRAVKGEYDEAHPNKMQAADDLFSFFGVGLCSTREQLAGCHVLRKEALKLQDEVSEDLP